MAHVDLRRDIVVCSHLFNELMLSFGVGVVIWVNMALPVVDSAHSFIQSSFLLHLMICFAVSSDVGTSVCGHDAPFFANLSTRSLPGMFACPGIH